MARSLTKRQLHRILAGRRDEHHLPPIFKAPPFRFPTFTLSLLTGATHVYQGTRPESRTASTPF